MVRSDLGRTRNAQRAVHVGRTVASGDPGAGAAADRGLLPVGPHSDLARRRVRVAAVALATLAPVCSGFLPLSMIHDAALEREAARVTDWHAKLDAMPADAPLWRWTPFLASDIYLVEEGAREAMRKLPSRQADAEAMLQRDEFPFGELGAFDLDPTPSLCDKARASLARPAAGLAPSPGPTHTYSEIANEAESASEGMKWLVGLGCAADAESRAWEALVRAYGGEDFVAPDFAKLRDPAELGRVLNNDPRDSRC